MIRKTLFQLEILFYFLKKNLLFILLGVFIGSFSLKLFPLISQFSESQSKQVQKIGITGLYTLENLPQEIKSEISTGLTVFSNNNKPVSSNIVTDWKAENDNKDYIFTLDTNLKWHDGQKLKPSDINYLISGAQITPMTDNQVKISLSKPYSPILSLLSQPILKKGTIGLGDYKIDKITYQKDFIKSISLLSLVPTKTNKTYIFYDQESKLIDAYKLAEIDLVKQISSAQDLSNWPKTKVSPQSQVDQSYIAIFLNTQKFNKDLRQALAYATPKTPNKEERCLGPISPTSWAYNDTIKPYDLSPQKAKLSLEEGGELTNINLAVNNRKLLPLADQIKETWQTVLGVKVNITIENQISPDKFDAVLAFAAIPQDPDQYEFWHSTQPKNITRINNPKLDKLLEEGRQTFDLIKRKEIYVEFQKILLEESPAIFLSYPITYSIERVK